MNTIEKLNAFGANTAEGLGRCAGFEAMYLRFVAMIPDEPSFDKLRSAIDEGDLRAAFEAAHTLKGVTGNLSLTPLYDKVCAVTELLRVKTVTDYDPMIRDILAMRDELKALCAD